MTRRGLTLIELLLAIGLVLIVGALVLPAIFTGLRERSFESAAEVVRNQLLLARAHAQLTRRPVEVVYTNVPPRRPGVRARYFLVDAPGPSIQRSTDGASSPDVEADPFPTDDQWQTDPDQQIVEGWADRDLPGGLLLTDRAVSDSTDAWMLRLAVYMPDGSALFTQPAWIRDDHGRRGRIDVNPWTGLPSFERITSARTDDATADVPENQP